MNNPPYKLETLGTQDIRRRSTQQNAIQYVLDTAVRKQTQIK